MRPHSWPLLLIFVAASGCGRLGDTDTGSRDTQVDDTADTTDTSVDTGTANQPPAAVADDVSTDEDAPTVVITALANDTDPESDPLDVVSIDTTGTTGAATLNDDDTITWMPGSHYQSLGAGAQATDSFTYTVSDGALTATATVTVTVTGVNDPPILVAPANQAHDEGALINLLVSAADPDSTLTWSAQGLPGGLSIGTSSGRIQGHISATAAPLSPYTVTVTATDGLASDDATFSWTVSEANVPPIFDDIPDQSNAEGELISLTASAEDPEGASVSYSATNLPPGLTIGLVTGAIGGTIDYTAAAGSPYSVTIHATDGDVVGATSFTWTVSNTNRAPTVNDPATQSDDEGDTIDLVVTGSDPDNDALSWSASGLPGGLSINPGTGHITGTVSFTASGPHTVTVTTSDGTDGDDAQFTWNIANTNRLPVFTGPGDQTNAENATIGLDMAVTDADGQAMTFAATSLPSTLSINTNTGKITGTLSFTSAGGYDVDVTANDGTGTAHHPFHWTVTNTNRPPTLNTIANQTNLEGAVVSVGVTASDPDLDTLTYSATGLPPGITKINTGSGTMSGTVSYTAGTTGFSVTVFADDGVTSVSKVFTWGITNVNRAPVVEDIGDQGNHEGDSVDVAITASDPDGDAIAQWGATNLPPGLAIANVAGVGHITGTPTFAAGDDSPYAFTVTATDSGGAPGQGSWSWVIQETTAPLCDRKLVRVTPGWLADVGTASTVAWFDADNDGDLDVFLRKSGFFQNDDDGAYGFSKQNGVLQTDTGVNDVGALDRGVTVGEENQDGWLDLFVPNASNGQGLPPNRMYLNLGLVQGRTGSQWGGFFDDAEALKIVNPSTTPGATAFIDANGDSEHDLTVSAEAADKSGHYTNLDGDLQPDQQFFDADLEAHGIAWADFDEDGDQDLFLVMPLSGKLDTKLFVQDQGNWKDEAQARGVVASKEASQYGGPTWADVDDDGLLDAHVVMKDQPDLVYVQQPDHTFKPVPATDFGIGESNLRNSSAVWVDYDLDGDLDVFLPDVGIFRNDSFGKYTDTTSAMGYDPSGVAAGAWADLDGDGFPELLVVSATNAARLYANERLGSLDTCEDPGKRPVDVYTDSDGDATVSDDEADYPAIGARIEVDLDGDGDFAVDEEKGERVAIYLIGQAQTGRAAVQPFTMWIGLGHANSKANPDLKVTFTDGSSVGVSDLTTGKTVVKVPDEGK